MKPDRSKKLETRITATTNEKTQKFRSAKHSKIEIQKNYMFISQNKKTIKIKQQTTKQQQKQHTQNTNKHKTETQTNMQFTSTIIVALLAVSTSTLTTAQKFSNLRGGDNGGHQLSAETVRSDASPAGVSALLEVQDPERSLVGDDECLYPGLFDCCPRFDHQDDRCPPDACVADEISCKKYTGQKDNIPQWGGKCYCFTPYKVGVDLDITADTATPAPADQVSPARKLQEEERILQQPASESSTTLDAQNGGCPWFASRVQEHDVDCVVQGEGKIGCYVTFYYFCV